MLVITSKIVYDLSKAVEDFLSGKRGPAAAGELTVLAIFSQDKLDKQLVGGRVEKGVFRGKASFEIMRVSGGGMNNAAGATPAADAPKVSAGNGRALTLHEKKAEIATAEKGKEIGIIVSSQIAIKVGDVLVIHK